MEFHTTSHIFDNNQEAIRQITADKNELKKKLSNNENLVFSSYCKVANDFLALSLQFEKAINDKTLKNFEHYPRLAADYAKEVLTMLTSDMSKEAQSDFINLYIENFDINEVIN